MKLEFTPEDCTQWAVAEVIGLEQLEAAFAAEQVLRVKLGIDPTSPDVHLGRSIPLWRLRAFQELGHEIHLIIGDFTGQIGDTSDKESERPMLSEEQVQSNLEGYLGQLAKIVDISKVQVHYNSQWLGKLSFAEVSNLADAFSVNSFIKRELVAKRLETGSRVSLREMLYPLMQGYDSLAINASVELGGTDQRFNLLAGRLLQERAGLPAQALIMNHLVRGMDGRKMSSSWGNVIAIREICEQPEAAFAKLMSLHDDLMAEYLMVLPRSAQPFTADELATRLAAGENPRDLKLELAHAIIELYHLDTPDVADRALRSWVQQFSEGQVVHTVSLSRQDVPSLLDLITSTTSWGESKTELRRVFAAGGVSLNGEKVSDPLFIPVPDSVGQEGFELKVGKKIHQHYIFE